MADQSAQNQSKRDLDKEAADATPKGKVNRIVAIGVAVLVVVIAAGVFFSFRFVEDERQRVEFAQCTFARADAWLDWNAGYQPKSLPRSLWSEIAPRRYCLIGSVIKKSAGWT